MLGYQPMLKVLAIGLATSSGLGRALARHKLMLFRG